MTGQTHAAYQADFAARLLTDKAPADAAMKVYRNTHIQGLIAVLSDAYPILKKLVGEAYFSALARAYIDQHPPRTRSLVLYGDQMASFISNFASASGVAYLPDVARLERARLEALHSADRPPLGFENVAWDKLDAMELRFVPAPAARLIAVDHPVIAIWQAQQQDPPPALQISACPQAVLVTRPELTVQAHAIDMGMFDVLAALFRGAPLGDAVAATGEAVDLHALFQTGFRSGAFCEIQHPSLAQSFEKG